MTTNRQMPLPDTRSEAPQPLSRADAAILRAVHAVRFGSVEIVIHDSRVVHLERREKQRFGTDGSPLNDANHTGGGPTV